jgi:sialate O-acetylesterase
MDCNNCILSMQHGPISASISYPLHVLYAICRYQGETDAWTTAYYTCMQDGMVSSWRDMWGQDFTFMFTQLSTWNAGGSNLLADFRSMQEGILDVTAKSAMITAADLGDPESPHGDIHPRNKTELGRRMSLAASSLIYGAPVAHMGPRVESAGVIPDAVLGYRVQVTFTSDSSEGLHLEAAQVCPESSAVLQMGCGRVQLVLNAGHSVVADVFVTGANTIELVPQSHLAMAPKQISYCQGDYPLMTVYNGIGAPLLPFVRDL